MDETETKTHALEELLDHARYHDAFQLVGGRSALTAVTSDARLGAAHARLARHLGSASLSQALARRLYHALPHDALARSAYAGHLLQRRGGYRTLRWLDERGVTDACESIEDATARALAYLQLRDVARARALLLRATGQDGRDLYPRALLAEALEVEARWSEACDAYAALHEQHPHYGPVTLGYVDALFHVGESARGLAVLRTFAEDTQAGHAHVELVRRYDQVGDLTEARAAIDRAKERLPLLGKREARYLLAMRYRVSYLLGDREDALACLTEWNTPSVRDLAQRTRAAAQVPGDVRLAVPHVRQDHATCAPASMTAICHYFGDRVTHREVVDAICFGGTPSVRQKRWAAARGMRVQSFDLNVDSGCALIDRGLPFALVTHGTLSSHMQVVIGYDPVRAAWLVMDPSAANEVVLEWDAIAKREAEMGPLATVFCPAAEVDRLAGLSLPRATEHDLYDAVAAALDNGDLAGAQAALQKLRALDPAAGLTCQAEADAARTLGDRDLELDATRRWLDRFPSSAHLQARVAELERAASVPLNTRVANLTPWENSWDARLLCEVARTLMAVPSRWSDAGRLLLRATLAAPTDAYTLGCMAELGCHERQWHQAMEASRFALCLDEAYEFAALTHFEAAKRLGRGGEALAFLESHAARVGARSSAPSTWLAQCYTSAGRVGDAIRVLQERSREERQEDALLQLRLVDLHLSLGDYDQARVVLARAERVASVVQTAPLRAKLATHEDAHTVALEALDGALQHAPWSTRLLREYARTLTRVQGSAAAREWLVERALARPELPGVVECACDWLRGDPEAESALLEVAIRARPRDAWLKRELALARAALGRPRDAEVLLDEVLSLNALDPVAHRLRGDVLADQHRTSDALSAYQSALALDPTERLTLDGIARLDLSLGEKRAALNRFVQRLEEGTPHGDDLFGVMPIARMLPADEALALGARLVARFPEHHAAHQCAVELGLHVAREDVAEAHLRAAFEHFPDVLVFQQLDLDLARRRNEHTRALAISGAIATRYPLDATAVLDHAHDLRRCGDPARAKEVLDAWLKRAGESSPVRRALASLWVQDSPEAALDILMPSLRAGVVDDTLWADAMRYAGEAKRTEALRGLVAELEERNPRHPRYPWYRACVSEGEARREAIERARELAPDDVAMVDELARYFADEGEFERALACCPPADWQGEVPVTLRGRRADIIQRQGNVQLAISEMMTILERDPTYAWGIERLAEWSRRTGRKAEHVHAARLRRALNPSSAASLTQLAEVLLSVGEPREAFEVLTEAHERHPENAYAAATLVRLLVDQGKYDDAAAFLRRIATTTTEGVRLEGAVRLRVARGDHLGAYQILRTALAPSIGGGMAGDDAAPIAEALVQGLPPYAALEKLLLEVLSDPGALHGEVFWRELVLALVLRYPQLLRTFVARIDTLSPVGLRLVGRALQRLDGKTAEGFRAELIAGRKRFPREVEVWAGVGYLLVDLGRSREAEVWTRDYASIEGLKPWMMWNRIVACMGNQSYFAALAACRDALVLPSDHLRPSLELVHAFLSTLAGEPCLPRVTRVTTSDERLLRDLLGLLHDARGDWRDSPDTFEHMSVAAWGTLVSDHNRALHTLESRAMELTFEALLALHAPLASRWARYRYRRRLRAQGDAARRGELDG